MPNLISPTKGSRKRYYLTAIIIGPLIGIFISFDSQTIPPWSDVLRSINLYQLFVIIVKALLEFSVSFAAVGLLATMLHECAHVAMSRFLGLPIRHVQIGIFKSFRICTIFGIQVSAGLLPFCGSVRPAPLNTPDELLRTKVRLVALVGPVVTFVALFGAWRCFGGFSAFHKLEGGSSLSLELKSVFQLSTILVLISQAIGCILPIPPRLMDEMLTDGWVAITGLHPDYTA